MLDRSLSKRLVEAAPPPDASPLRFDPFRILGAEERSRHIGAYRSHLEARNGEIDLEGRRLVRREQFFRSLSAEPVVSGRPLDRRVFQERLRGSRATRIDPVTAWLVAVAKASIGETYGVDLELAKYDRDDRYARDRRYLEEVADDAEVAQLYAFMEELYHGRLLTEMCTTLGCEMTHDPPRWRMRAVIQLINRTPDRIRWPLVFCAEVVGATSFKILVDRCGVFGDEPAVEKRLRTLIGAIWRDEVLHVALLRARLGPTGMWMARRLFPLVLDGLLRDVPELFELGSGRDEFLRLLRRGIEVPPDVDWIPADPLPAA